MELIGKANDRLDYDILDQTSALQSSVVTTLADIFSLPDGYHDFDGSCECGDTPSVDDHVAVYWPGDDAFYPRAIQSVTANGHQNVRYDDVGVETPNLSNN